MALDVDLSVEELSDTAVLYLSELLAPVNAFSVLSPEDSRVKSTGTSGGVYQVEVTGTLPSANDNVANFETGHSQSATNSNVSVTTASISTHATVTNLEQQQGIPFRTLIDSLSKGLANGIWDKCTAMMNGASFTDAGAAASSAALTIAEIQSLRTQVDSMDVVLLVEHSSSENLLPDNRESFGAFEPGAYGYSRIYPVSNFTGGKTNQMALAASKECAVAIAGLPLQAAENLQLTQSNALLENFTIESVGIPVELRIWQNTATRDLHMTMQTIFGISEAQSSAAAFLDHA